MKKLEYHIVEDHSNYILLFKVENLHEDADTDMGDDFHFYFDTTWPDENKDGILLHFNLGGPWNPEVLDYAIPVMKKAAEMDPLTVKELVKLAEAVGAHHNPEIFSYGYLNAR